MKSPPADSPGPPGAFPTRPSGLGRRHAVLVALCSLAFLTYLDRIAISRVQDEVARDLRFATLTEEDEAALAPLMTFDVSEEEATKRRAALAEERSKSRMAWIFTAFLIGYVLFEIPGGRLGDLHGPRRTIVRIVVWWSIFTALTGSVGFLGGLFQEAPSPALLFGILFAIRFLFGLGEAGAFPNIARALGRWFPYEERVRAQGLIWLSSRLGGAAGPVTVGTILRFTGDWRSAFWLLGAVGIAWALWFSWWYRDRPEEMGGTSEEECAWIRGGGAGAFVDDETLEGSIYDDRPAREMPWHRLVVWPNVLAMYIASAGVSFSFYFYLTFLPRYLKEVHGVATEDSEIMCGLPLAAGCVGCFVGGHLSDWIARRTRSRRWARSLPGFIGFGGAGVAMALTMLAPSAWPAVALLTLAFFCQDMGVPCIWSLPADIGGRHAGVLGGAMNSIGALGGVFSPLVVSWVHTDGAADWNGLILLYAGGYLAAGLAWLAIDASKQLEGGRR